MPEKLSIEKQANATQIEKKASNHPVLDSVLEHVLSKASPFLQNLLARKNELKIQFIYTTIDRATDQTPLFTHHFYNVDDQHYFYPASTVKLPTALIALQKIRSLAVPGLDRSSTMITEATYSGQTAVSNDSTAIGGLPSIEHYIKKILLVSDNDAFNRLYEFLGQSYINNELLRRGLKSAAIQHRLERALTEDENRHTNPVYFKGKVGQILYRQSMQFNEVPYPNRNDHLGVAYMRGEEKVEGPMDFSKKNRLSLTDLHSIVQSIIFPGVSSIQPPFEIAENDRAFLLKYMSMLPNKSDILAYHGDAYWDTYCKFLLCGAEKGRMPPHVKIFNKVGDAYGFLIDAAYVIDTQKNLEFLLSAVIYCNEDGILNDSQYDYESIGFPFMKELGQLFYNYESTRPRTNKPNLENFIKSYENSTQ